MNTNFLLQGSSISYTSISRCYGDGTYMRQLSCLYVSLLSHLFSPFHLYLDLLSTSPCACLVTLSFTLHIAFIYLFFLCIFLHSLFFLAIFLSWLPFFIVILGSYDVIFMFINFYRYLLSYMVLSQALIILINQISLITSWKNYSD